jgi:hypothetical protein
VKIRMDRQRLITAAMVAAALTFIVAGVSSAVTGTASQHPPAGVDRFVPAPGELVLRQTQVGADLASGYRGNLIIDGQSIPTYDLGDPGPCATNTAKFTGIDSVFDGGSNTVYFTPRTGSTIERFAPGEHRITVEFWKICESQETAQRATWTFKVS